MKKTLIIIGSTFVVLILLVVGLVNFYFTNDRLQRMIVPQLEETIGQPVQVESMSISIFSTLPDAALHINNFSIPGQQTETDTLLSVRNFSIRVEILPLWYDNVNITKLSLDRPRFTYMVYQDGTTNLDFLTAADTTGTSESPPTDTSLTNIQIPTFTIHNARFGYVDQSNKSEFMFDQLDADVSLDYGRQITTSMDLKIGKLTARSGDETYFDGLPVQLSQESVLDLDKEILELKKGELSIRGLTLDLTGNLADWSSENGPSADLQFGTSAENLDDLLKLAPSSYRDKLLKYQTRGSMTVNGLIKGNLGGKAWPSYDLTVKVKDGYLKNPDLADPITDIQLDARMDNSALKLNTFRATAGPNKISMSGTITDPLETAKSQLDLSMETSLDLATIKNFYPLDPDTLSLNGQLNATARLKGKLDQLQEGVQEAQISLTDGRIDYPTLIGPPLTDIQFESNIQGKNLTLKKFSATSQGNTIQANGTVTDYWSDTPNFNIKADGTYDLSQTHHYYQLAPYISEMNGMITLDANIRGNNFDPLQWDLNGNLQLDDVNVVGDSLPQPLQKLNGKVEVKPESMQLKSITFLLGESDFNMQGNLTNYMEFLKPGEEGLVPQFTGQYKSSLLNVDEFIDWEEETDPETVYPIDLPHLQSKISTSIDTLIVMGIPFYNVEGEAGTTPNEMIVKNATGELLEGKIKGSMNWTVRNPLDTHLDIKGSIEKVRADAFFRNFQMFGGENELQKYVEGAFSTEFSYQSDINKHLMPVLSTTVSSGNFGLTKVRLKGHPLQENVASFLKTPALKNMAMDEWTANYSINKSVLQLKDLKLTSGNIGAEISGTQQLETGAVDYNLKLYLPNRFKEPISSVITSRATEALTQKNGTILLPLRVTGTQSSPQIKPNREVIDPIVTEYIQNKAGDVIKGLFK